MTGLNDLAAHGQRSAQTRLGGASGVRIVAAKAGKKPHFIARVGPKGPLLLYAAGICVKSVAGV